MYKQCIQVDIKIKTDVVAGEAGGDGQAQLAKAVGRAKEYVQGIEYVPSTEEVEISARKGLNTYISYDVELGGYPSRTPAWMGARLQGCPHIVHAESPPALASLDRSGRESPCSRLFSHQMTPLPCFLFTQVAHGTPTPKVDSLADVHLLRVGPELQ